MHTLTYPLSFHYLFNDLCIRNSLAPRSSTLFSYFFHPLVLPLLVPPLTLPLVPGSRRERTSCRFSVPENERCTCARVLLHGHVLRDDIQKEDNMKKARAHFILFQPPAISLLSSPLLLLLILLLFLVLVLVPFVLPLHLIPRTTENENRVLIETSLTNMAYRSWDCSNGIVRILCEINIKRL